MRDKSWYYPDLADAVWQFVPEALLCLKGIFGTPHFGKPRYAMRSWRRSKNEIDTLQETPVAEEWLEQYDRFSWKGADQLCALGSFQRLARLVASNEELNRRIYAAQGTVTHQMYMPGSNPLCYFMQDAILRPLINEAKSFELDEGLLTTEYERVEQALKSPVISYEYFIALRNIEVTEDVPLNAHCSLRLLSDSELNTGIAFGAIEVYRWGRNSATLSLSNQHAIRSYRKLVVDEAFLTRSDFYEVINGVVTGTSPPLDMANRVVSALNLYSDEGAVEIGGVWSTANMALTSMSHNLNADYSRTKRRSSKRSVVWEEEIPSFRSLFNLINRRSTWTRLHVALTRFSSATCRTSDDEAIVDLAIASESLFGSPQPGEVTHKISLNAAIFLGNADWPASAVRAFFREVYAKRSAIVHGTSQPHSKSQSDKVVALREKLEDVMRRALKMAINELSVDNSALNWDKRLDTVLDAHTPPKKLTSSE